MDWNFERAAYYLLLRVHVDDLAHVEQVTVEGGQSLARLHVQPLQLGLRLVDARVEQFPLRLLFSMRKVVSVEQWIFENASLRVKYSSISRDALVLERGQHEAPLIYRFTALFQMASEFA